MASFNVSANHSFYQKQMIEKAFQNLLEESMRFECPSIIKKFSNSSDLNLSSVRADLFTSMKLSQNKKKWRKDLKKKSKTSRKRHPSEQASGYQFSQLGFAPPQESHVVSSDDRPQKTSQGSSQQFVFKPNLVSGTKGKKQSDFEFVIPEVFNSQPSPAASKKNQANRVRTVSGHSDGPSNARVIETRRKRSGQVIDLQDQNLANRVRTASGRSDEMGPPNAWVSETKKKLSSQILVQPDKYSQLKPCKVLLDKNEMSKDGHKILPVGSKKEKLKEVSNNKNYVFDQWIFRIDVNDDIFIKGHLSDSPANVFWSTSEIVKRIDHKTLLTASGKLCILEGPLMTKAMTSKGYPMDLIKKFNDGFPLHWKNILKSKRLPKVSAEVKENRHQTVKKETVEEDERDNEEEQEQQDDDHEEEMTEESEEEEDEMPISQKLGVIKENSETPAVEKNPGNECDYLFDIFSQNVQVNFSEFESSPPPVCVPQKQSTEQDKKQIKEELVGKVAALVSPIRTRYMTRSRTSSLEGKSAQSARLEEKQKNSKIIPKGPKQTSTKNIADEYNSPHPLSNTLNSVPAGSPRKKASNSGRKSSAAAEKNSPVKSSRVKKSETQKTKPKQKQPSHRPESQKPSHRPESQKPSHRPESQKPSHRPESQKPSHRPESQKPSKCPEPKKPSVAKKQTKGAEKENPDSAHSKKTTKRKKSKDSGGKMIKDWTNEEVQKLLTAMSSVSKTDVNFWQKVARKVGRSPEECTNYYCSCDLSSLDWKDLKKKDEKKEEPQAKRKNLHIYDVSSSYEDDLFESENFLGHTKKIRLNQDCHLDNIFADLSVKTPSISSDQNFHTPMSKFFLSPVSERQTPASTNSDGDIKIDWDNADRCVKEFKKKQKKGAGRLKLPRRLAELKSEFKPKSLQLGSLVDELNKINNIPEKSDKDDETEDSNQNIYFSSESED